MRQQILVSTSTIDYTIKESTPIRFSLPQILFERPSVRPRIAHGIRELLLQNDSTLSYPSLVGFWRRGLRNGNWGMLNIAERGLFRCALWVAKVRGKISNTKLMVEVLKLALKLIEGFRSHILKAGRRRAVTMYQAYGRLGVFSWAPRVREWLSDPNYVLYLGVLAVNP